MADVAHLEKMGRELKCPICWSLLKSTVSLPCNHVFCYLCISKSMKSDSSCPVCKVPYARREVRPAPHMDNLVEIYKCMELASGVNILVTQAAQSSLKQEVEEQNGSDKRIAKKLSGRKRRKQGSSKPRKPRKKTRTSNVVLESQKVTGPSSLNKKRIQVSPHPRNIDNESPVASGKVQQLDTNGSGFKEGTSSSDKNSNESEVRPEHSEQQSVIPRGACAVDHDGKVILSPFFWLREQENYDETAEKQSFQQLETDHVTNSPPYVMPAFSDLKDSEDGSPDKGEVHSRSKLLNMYDSEMFEWTQRPCSPELHSVIATKEDKEMPPPTENAFCEPMTLSTELADIHDQLRNPICGQECGLGNIGMPILDGQGSESNGNLHSRSESAKGVLKTRSRTRTINGNRSSQKVKHTKPKSSMIKKGTGLITSEANPNQTVRETPKMDGDIPGLECLEAAHDETTGSRKKLGSQKKPNNKASHISGNENSNKSRKTCMPTDVLSDMQVKDISMLSAAGKSSCGYLRDLNRSFDSTSNQPDTDSNLVKSVTFADLTNLGRTEIDDVERKTSENNIKSYTRQKMISAESCKSCTDKCQEINLELSPIQSTEPLNDVEAKSSDANGTERDDKECMQAKQHVRRDSTGLRLGNPTHSMNQVNRSKGRKRRGTLSRVPVDVVPQSLRENASKPCDIPQDEPKVSEEASLHDIGVVGQVQTVTMVAGKDLKLKHCDSMSTPISCIFCHSSIDSEASGCMLHFVNGKTVSSDYGGGFSVIHAHRNCAEWAPDVYFEAETIINLEKEAARSKKIKCSSCGIKGAALGCYEKSCRKSYHVSCAKAIVECRWDMENFVMFCPVHASFKLPKEQPFPKKQKIKKTSHKRDAEVQTTVSLSWHWPSGTPQKWVLCCSALGSAEKELVLRFSKVAGLQVSKRWCSNVTHVIASVDEIGACRRTLKFLLGILEGKWMVNINWIKACLEAMKPVDEKSYEIMLDVHGNRNGPQNGRMRVLEKGPKLFNGFKFYFSGDFEAFYRGYLQDLIVAAGGTVLQRKPIASEASASQTFILYNLKLPEKCKPSQASCIVSGRRKEAETLAMSTGAKAIDNSWVLDSISTCKLQSPV